jgi:hypothetical protein
MRRQSTRFDERMKGVGATGLDERALLDTVHQVEAHRAKHASVERDATLGESTAPIAQSVSH